MALNYDKTGKIFSGPAPEDVVSGQAILLGVVAVAIAQGDALEGEMCSFAIEGVWEVPSEGPAHDVGQPMTFNAATGAFSIDAGASGDLENAAMSFSPGGGGADTVLVKINTHLGDFVETP